jgi:hypothetical protein
LVLSSYFITEQVGTYEGINYEYRSLVVGWVNYKRCARHFRPAVLPGFESVGFYQSTVNIEPTSTEQIKVDTPVDSIQALRSLERNSHDSVDFPRAGYSGLARQQQPPLIADPSFKL